MFHWSSYFLEAIALASATLVSEVGSWSQELEFGVHPGARGGRFELILELSLVPFLGARNRSCELVVRARGWWSEPGAGGQSRELVVRARSWWSKQGACDQSWELVARAESWWPELRARDQSGELVARASSWEPELRTWGSELEAKVWSSERNGLLQTVTPHKGQRRLRDVDRD